MPRKEYKYHFIYKTTCLLNDNYYVGMHSTSNLEDGYLGSGKRLHYAIRKHGKENFKREILDFCDSKISLKRRESELVNDDLLKDPKCINLQHGGGGGISGEVHKKRFREGSHKYLKNLWGNLEYRDKMSIMSSAVMKKNHAEGKMKYDNFVGKHHTKESKECIGSKNKIKQSGSGNSQYGTCWITNGKENKKIHRGDILPNGYILGRKTK